MSPNQVHLRLVIKGQIKGHQMFKKSNSIPSWIYLLPFFAAFSIMAFVDLVGGTATIGIVGARVLFDLDFSDQSNQLLLVLLLNIGVDLAGVGFYLLLTRKKITPLPLQTPNKRYGLATTLKTYAVVFSLVIILGLALNAVWESIAPSAPTTSPYDSLMIDDTTYTVLNVLLLLVMVAIIAPIFEELVFRRLLIPLFEGTGKMSTMLAVVASSLMFALVHTEADLISGSPRFAVSHFLTASLLGFALGAIYVTTRDVRFPILFHALNNGWAIFGQLVLYFEPLDSPDDLGVLTTLFGLVVLVLLGGGVIFMLYYLYHFKRVRNALTTQLQAPKDQDLGQKVMIVAALLALEAGLFVLLPIIENVIVGVVFNDPGIIDLLLGLVVTTGVFVFCFYMTWTHKQSFNTIGETTNPPIPDEEPQQPMYQPWVGPPQGYPQQPMYQPWNDPSQTHPQQPPQQATTIQQCPSCGGNLPQQTMTGKKPTFCPTCGFKLPQPLTTPQQGHEQSETTTKRFCGECGKPLAVVDGRVARFCHFCGTKNDPQ